MVSVHSLGLGESSELQLVGTGYLLPTLRLKGIRLVTASAQSGSTEA